jgi:hypothetical protein
LKHPSFLPHCGHPPKYSSVSTGAFGSSFIFASFSLCRPGRSGATG